MSAARLVLVRGLPGSGKSTIARELAAVDGRDHFEADSYHERSGRYVFNPAEAADAHAWCKLETRRALDAGRRVVVANTFVTLADMAPYFEMCDDVDVLEATGTWESVHDVSASALAKMRRKWQPTPAGDAEAVRQAIADASRAAARALDFMPDGRERGDDDPSIKRDEREAGSIGGGTERSDTLAVDIDDFDSYGAPSDNAELADLVSFGDLADDEPDDAGDDQEPDEHGPSSSYAGADARVTKARLRHKVHRMKRHEIAAELFATTGLPAPGECLHVLGNGGFNAWEVLVLLIEAAAPVEAYLNTWTMNYSYAVDILRECDAGRIAPCHFLSSQNLSSLRPDVYATLLHGFRRRGYDFACVPTHTKVTLLSNPDAGAWYVVETSANYTGNPRLEQYVVTNSRQVHDFHREWMDLIFAAERKRGAT